jgi:hypothetical protein
VLCTENTKQQSNPCYIYHISSEHVTNEHQVTYNKSDKRYFRLLMKTLEWLKLCQTVQVFGSVISMERFESICRFLHFIDDTSKDTSGRPQKLFKIYLVISHINSKFRTLYLAEQEISVNALVTLWKGCLS